MRKTVEFIYEGKRLEGKVIARNTRLKHLTVSVPRNQWSDVKDCYEITESEVLPSNTPSKDM